MPAEVATRPAYRSLPAHAMSNGDIAAEIGAMVGLDPDPNQRDILDGIFAESSPGRLACFEAAIIGPRQNIKSSTLEVAALTDLFIYREPLHIWTAHLYKTTRGAFRDMIARIDGCPDLRVKCRPPITGNGSEAIELLTGERIEFHARSKGGGRGLTARRVTLDEALLLGEAEMGALLPTMATVQNAQVRYGSSAGLATSEVLRAVRDRGRSGADPSLGYWEWCSPRRTCEMPRCTHQVGTSGCALDDESLWWPANPALGDRITLENLRKFRRSMPASEFMREFLGWWDEPASIGQGIPPELWQACRAPAERLDEGISFGLDVALDRSRSSIGVAVARSDGRAQLELVESRPGTGWVAERLAEIYDEWHAPVYLDAAGPAASLVADLQAARVRVEPLPRAEVVQACGAMFDAVKERSVVHLGDPLLTTAVMGAQLRPGESFVFTRKGDTDISPLYAVTLALRGFTLRDAPSVYESRDLIVL